MLSRTLYQHFNRPAVSLLLPMQTMNFTGKTESGHKFKTPKLRMRKVKPIPPPGEDLKIPVDLTPEKFCRMIGGDCEEIADKFEDDINAVFTENTMQMKARDIPVDQRKYIRSKQILFSLYHVIGCVN